MDWKQWVVRAVWAAIGGLQEYLAQHWGPTPPSTSQAWGAFVIGAAFAVGVAEINLWRTPPGMTRAGRALVPEDKS